MRGSWISMGCAAFLGVCGCEGPAPATTDAAAPMMDDAGIVDAAVVIGPRACERSTAPLERFASGTRDGFALSGDRYAVAWTEMVPFGPPPTSFLRVTDAGGAPIGEPRSIERALSLVGIDGGFVAIEAAGVQRYDLDGAPVGARIAWPSGETMYLDWLGSRVVYALEGRQLFVVVRQGASGAVARVDIDGASAEIAHASTLWLESPAAVTSVAGLAVDRNDLPLELRFAGGDHELLPWTMGDDLLAAASDGGQTWWTAAARRTDDGVRPVMTHFVAGADPDVAVFEDVPLGSRDVTVTVGDDAIAFTGNNMFTDSWIVMVDRETSQPSAATTIEGVMGRPLLVWEPRSRSFTAMGGTLTPEGGQQLVIRCGITAR